MDIAPDPVVAKAWIQIQQIWIPKTDFKGLENITEESLNK
jgi:hypothetical protein